MFAHQQRSFSSWASIPLPSCCSTYQVCCCLMPCWPSELTRQTRTKTEVGRRSPTLWCTGSAATWRASSSCCGAHMLRRKGPRLTGCATSLLFTQPYQINIFCNVNAMYFYDVLFKSYFLAFQKRHHVLQAVHPSPLSAHRGFFGCKHFSKANELLKKSGKSPVDWKAL